MQAAKRDPKKSWQAILTIFTPYCLIVCSFHGLQLTLLRLSVYRVAPDMWASSWFQFELHPLQLQNSNRPFPSCLLPQCQTESSCGTIRMKMSLPTRSFSSKSFSFSYERFRAKTRFETEAQDNSEMA